MNRYRTPSLMTLLACLLLMVGCAAIPRFAEEKEAPLTCPATEEFRALWVTRFEWPDPEPERCQEKIRAIFDNLQRANFNAAVFQVRGQADVLYPSPYEPWSPLIGSRDPGWDPLAFAIEEAHQRGIQLHAYVNPIPLWSSATPPPHTTPEHLYHRHGPNAEVSWVCHDATGNPMQVRGHGYYYLSPGIPEVQAYLRRVFIDLVERYDLDGLHYDRIRYPGPRYSHDPISKRRFAGPGNPNHLSWEDWQREQLNKWVNDMAAEIAARKPWLRVSCAAWGIYDRNAIPGYSRFSSGYHDYYQDTLEWVRLGAMDTLMPMIYWAIPDPKPNYDELLEYFVSQVGPERMVGGMSFRAAHVPSGELFHQIEVTRALEAQGNVMFSLGGVARADAWEAIREGVYRSPAKVPGMPWKQQPRFGVLSGRVLGAQGQPVTDAVVELQGREKKWVSGSDGFFAFLQVPPGPATLRITPPGGAQVAYAGIELAAGEVTAVDVPAKAPTSSPARFEFRSPSPAGRTSQSFVNVLVHTDAGNRGFVNGEEVHVYRTGIFVADQIPLKMGLNRIEAAVETPEGMRLSRVRWVERTEPEPPSRPPALPLEIVPASVQPKEERIVQPGDWIPVQFRGSPGHFASFRIGDRMSWQAMTELPGSATGESSGLYSGAYVVQPNDCFEDTQVTLRLERNPEVATGIRSPRWVSTESPSGISTLDPTCPLIAEVTGNSANLKVGLGEVRLGGPILTTVPQGTRLRLSGKIGSNWRVCLSESVEAWVEQRAIRLLPPGTQPAWDYLTSFTVTGDEKYDVIYIPNSARVPFRVRPIDEPNGLWIDLYGITANTTWITQHLEAKGVKRVNWEQIEPSLYRLMVELEYPQLWGYEATQEGNTLMVRIKRPPVIAGPPSSPVAGLLIALEAGHGGPTNVGARGLSGTLEKDVNYGTTTKLAALLEQRGARIVMLRRGDETITIEDRIQRALDSKADMLISIHANAAGSERGYLRVSGTSTNYKYNFVRPLSLRIYERMLQLGLSPFGNIGSRNYRPSLITQMPALHVEQGFMTHPGDEELLNDPEFQQKMAEAIAQGIEDYLREQRP